MSTKTPRRTLWRVVTLEEVRAVAATLPRSYEAFVRGAREVPGRDGSVYLAFSHDEAMMGFAFS